MPTPSTGPPTPDPPPKHHLNILLLHGYTQSGPLFHSKTRALEKNLRKSFPPSHYHLTLSYPTAPVQILAPDIPGHNTDDLGGAHSAEDSWGWFQKKGEGEPYVYERFEEGLGRVGEVLRREGPFDGVVGFSQGGFMAGTVASLLEEGRREGFERLRAEGGMEFPRSFLLREAEVGVGGSTREDGVAHPPMKFAVSYSGFGATPNVLYTPLYEPKIKTPMLHFLGSVDTVVEEARTMKLVDATEAGRHSEEGKRRIVWHPGGHFLPASQRSCLIPLLGFIREAMSWDAQGAAAPMGSRAKEELELPF